MEQKGVGLLISIFVIIIIGLALIGVTSNSINRQAVLDTVTDEQFTASNTSCVDFAKGCITSITSIENATGAVTMGTGNYTLCDINKKAPFYDGVIINTGASYNGIALNGLTLNATFETSLDCTYNSNSTSKNLSTLILVFFVLAIMAVVIFGVYKSGLFDGFKKD